MKSFQLYLIKRTTYIGLTLFLISFIIFAVTQLLPGNAAEMILGLHASEERIAAVEAQLGLDRPWYIQYIDWVTGVPTGDWGESFVYRKPVAEIVVPRFKNSVLLAGAAMVSVILIGIPLGIIAAYYQGKKQDITVTAVSYIGIGVPEFVTGTLLIYLFAGQVFNILPSGGYALLTQEGLVDWGRHMILPTATLTFLLIAHVMRQTRSEMIKVLQTDYVRSARLKGMAEKKVIIKHALRNGLLPTITVLALDIGYLMGSIVIVEEIFAYPGIGRLVVSAIQERDLPTLQICVLIIAATYAIANLVADLLYTYLNPEIEYR